MKRGVNQQAKAPMIYCGGGIIFGEASAELLEFVERTGIPVATTLMGIGCFPSSTSCRSNGSACTARLRQQRGQPKRLAPRHRRAFRRSRDRQDQRVRQARTIVHIDIDNSEIQQDKVVKLPILSDVKYAAGRLTIARSRPARKRVRPASPLSPTGMPRSTTARKVPVHFQGHGRRHPAAVRIRLLL